MLTLRQTVIVQDWLKDKVFKIKNNVDKNYKATGKTKDSVQWSMTDSSAQITALDTIYFGEFGRGKTTKGSKPKGQGILKDIIRQWIDVKGIQPRESTMSKDTLAFLIARKINRDGIKVPNEYNAGQILSSVLNEKAVEELIREFGAVLIQEFESDILPLFKKQ